MVVAMLSFCGKTLSKSGKELGFLPHPPGGGGGGGGGGMVVAMLSLLTPDRAGTYSGTHASSLECLVSWMCLMLLAHSAMQGLEVTSCNEMAQTPKSMKASMQQQSHTKCKYECKASTA